MLRLISLKARTRHTQRMVTKTIKRVAVRKLPRHHRHGHHLFQKMMMLYLTSRVVHLRRIQVNSLTRHLYQLKRKHPMLLRIQTSIQGLDRIRFPLLSHIALVYGRT